MPATAALSELTVDVVAEALVNHAEVPIIGASVEIMPCEVSVSPDTGGHSDCEVVIPGGTGSKLTGPEPNTLPDGQPDGEVEVTVEVENKTAVPGTVAPAIPGLAHSPSPGFPRVVPPPLNMPPPGLILEACQAAALSEHRPSSPITTTGQTDLV